MEIAKLQEIFTEKVLEQVSSLRLQLYLSGNGEKLEQVMGSILKHIMCCLPL